MGAALAAIEWVWAYSDSSDPTSEQWNGLTLVVWTGLIALIGFSLWVAGAMVGAATRQRAAPRAGLRTARPATGAQRASPGRAFANVRSKHWRQCPPGLRTIRATGSAAPSRD